LPAVLIPASLDTLRELHARAVVEQNRGRPRSAMRLLGQALAAADSLDRSDEADALVTAISISVALNRAELEGAAAGLEEIERATDRAARLGDPALLVRAHSQRAFIAIRAGRYPLALSAFAAAEDLLEHADSNDRFAILLNAGTLRLFEGELTGARRSLRRAAELARRADMADGLFKALHNLGYAEFLAGNLPDALRLMDEAGAVDTRVSRGVWLLDRSRVLAEAGLVHAAEQSLAQAGEIFRRDRLTQDLGETELERARCALITGDVASARRLAARARDRFRRRGNDRWRRSAELVLLQGDLAAGRPGGRLTGPALRLREEFRRDGVRLPAQTAALIAAEAHLAAGQVDAARSTLADLARPGRRDPITARLHTHYVRARLDATTGRPAAASRRARAALNELAAYQAGFGSIDLATAAAVHGRRLAELDLALALDTGRPEAVLGAAERARAVTNRLAAVRPPEDPVAAELLAELRQTVETLRTVEQDPAASAPLSARRHELEARIAARGWTRAGSGEVGAVTGLDELRDVLGDATLVSYSRVGARLHAVVVSGGRLRLVALGDAGTADEQARRVRADLDVLAQPALPAPLRAAVTASLRRSLGLLDETLLAPLKAGGRVVVVSTGLLGQLPWGLVPSLRAVPVVVTPSATSWHGATTRAASRQRRVVVVAGPGLARAADEADAVAGAWAASRIEGGAATGAAFAAAMARARIAHVAAHGVHQTENPLFSSVRLADGPLFAHELDRTARTPEHVVLSACELGLATVRPGDEALGLTSVLLHRGTRSVVAGVARVGDELAAEAMADYHRRLRAGQDAAASLAATMERHPFLPFVCFGATFSS
jgi:hypothetical protein